MDPKQRTETLGASITAALHDIRIATDRTTSVHPFVFLEGWPVKNHFLLNFTLFKHKLLKLRTH